VRNLRFVKSIILLVSVLFSLAASAQEDTLVLKKSFIGHKDGIECITVSPTGKYFATGGSQGNVILWDTTGSRVREFKGHSTKVTHIAFD
jgi:WD40 repeat protein